MMSEFPALDELVEKCDYDTKLAVTAWVFQHIVEHAKEGGSFRYLIYDRLGFDIDSYIVLYEAGGMDISNEFDLTQKQTVIKIAQEKKYEEFKPALNLCDEPGCFKEITCGFPQGGTYRRTCHEHSGSRYDIL